MNNKETKRSIILTAVFALLTLGVAVFCYFVTNFGSVVVLITAVIFLIILLRFLLKKRYRPCFVCSIVFTVVLLFSALFWLFFLLLPINSTSKFKYPYEMAYICDSRPGKSTRPEFFPKEIPSSATDYELDFLPSLMQGQGHLTVSFKADDEYIEDLKSSLEDKAIHIVPVKEFGAFNEQIHSEDPEDPFREVDLYWGKWNEEHPNGTVYIISTNYYSHHPHADAVIIDGDYVFFTNY